MDAHQLDFPAGHFDLVFGAGILHHLDLDVALRELHRVLRPSGLFVFSEPLDNNPVGWLVRWLTPRARTEDETPFRFEHIASIRRWFDCELHFEQLLSVPVGLVSRALFKEPDNGLTRFAYSVDEFVQLRLPAAGPYFRKVTMVGRKRSHC